MRQTAETKINNSTKSPVTNDIDDAVGMSSRQWYIGIVPPKHEKKVCEQLASKGYETFVAAQSRLRVYSSGRKKWVSQVLIHSRIFIKCTDKERHIILQNPEVLRFMTNPSGQRESGHRPLAIVSEKEMDLLKYMLGQKEIPVSFEDRPFKRGEIVRIIRGSLKGLEGTVISTSNGKKEISIKLDFLGCALATIASTDVILNPTT